MQIKNIRKLDKKFIQYDIQTETHNFYIYTSDNSRILVHNSPAVVACTDYYGKKFVGMKHSWEKGNVYDSVEAINIAYGDNPAVRDKFIELFSKLDFINIPKNEIWMGDYLFSKKDLYKETFNGEECIVFQPNTIVYAIPLTDPIANLIQRADFGVAWHTKYVGEDKQLSFDVSVDRVNNVPNVFQVDGTIPNMAGKLTLTKEETETVGILLERMKKGLDDLCNDPNFNTILQDVKLVKKLQKYQNNIVRRNFQHGSIEDFTKWEIEEERKEVNDRLKKAKSEKGIERIKGELDNVEETARNYVQNLPTETIEKIWDTQSLVVPIKELYESKIYNVSSLKTYVNHVEQGYIPTSGEGYAVSDIDGNVHKVVSRIAFSRFNFDNANYKKGWSNERRESQGLTESAIKKFKEENNEEISDNDSLEIENVSQNNDDINNTDTPYEEEGVGEIKDQVLANGLKQFRTGDDAILPIDKFVIKPNKDAVNELSKISSETSSGNLKKKVSYHIPIMSRDDDHRRNWSPTLGSSLENWANEDPENRTYTSNTEHRSKEDKTIHIITQRITYEDGKEIEATFIFDPKNSRNATQETENEESAIALNVAILHNKKNESKEEFELYSTKAGPLWKDSIERESSYISDKLLDKNEDYIMSRFDSSNSQVSSDKSNNIMKIIKDKYNEVYDPDHPLPFNNWTAADIFACKKSFLSTLKEDLKSEKTSNLLKLEEYLYDRREDRSIFGISLKKTHEGANITHSIEGFDKTKGSSEDDILKIIQAESKIVKIGVGLPSITGNATDPNANENFINNVTCTFNLNIDTVSLPLSYRRAGGTNIRFEIGSIKDEASKSTNSQNGNIVANRVFNALDENYENSNNFYPVTGSQSVDALNDPKKLDIIERYIKEISELPDTNILVSKAKEKLSLAKWQFFRRSIEKHPERRDTTRGYIISLICVVHFLCKRDNLNEDIIQIYHMCKKDLGDKCPIIKVY